MKKLLFKLFALNKKKDKELFLPDQKYETFLKRIHKNPKLMNNLPILFDLLTNFRKNINICLNIKTS